MVEPNFSDKSSLIRRGYSALIIQKIKYTKFIIIDKLYNFYIIFKIDLPELMLKFLLSEQLFL